MPGYRKFTTSGLEHRSQESNRGGLAGTVRTQKADDLTLAGRKTDILDRTSATVVLGESHRLHGHAGHWPARSS